MDKNKENKGQYTVKLKFPVTMNDGRKFEEVTFKKRPTGRDMKNVARMYDTAEERELHLICICLGLRCAVPSQNSFDDDLSQFDLLDIKTLQEAFSDFLHQKKDGRYYSTVAS